jgi:DNA-binding winged helix-turn-helix (wHTH) protein
MRVQFGRFEFDSDRRLLLEGDRPVGISPKAFLLLQTLIDHRPQAVSKQQLFDALWPDTHVLEANLTNLVAELRKALGETGRAGDIRTVHGFGYAFDGTVAVLPPLTAEAATPSSSRCWLLIGEREVALNDGDYLLGREPACQVPLLDPSVSRRHARLRIVGEQATLVDLGSKNGTLLNGVPVEGEALLTEGDVLHLGTVRVVFRRFSPSEITRTLSMDRVDLARRLGEEPG